MELLSSFKWTISEMVEFTQKLIMTFQDVRATKFVAGFSISFFFISCLIAAVAILVSRTPIWKSNEKSNTGLELKPYVERNIIKKSNINFLPDTNELRIYEDDTIRLDGLQDFRQTRTQHVDHSANEPEALISLRMALQMRKGGKHVKAQKLFQHALALNPVQPDILTHYGEFLEHHHQDVIKADHMYTRALIVCPEHSKALVNRQRTLPVVEELDEKQLSRIDHKRDRLIHIPDNDSALKRMKKEAYFQHIHHTVAIEGNTMTLAETRTVVETRMAVPGKSIIEHNEILGLESALKYINTTLVNKYGMINAGDILQIHKRVLGHVDPLEAGSFRRSQVFVGEHTPPSAAEIIDMMEDFVDWMNSEEAFSLHPVKHSALVHYKLVYIHPFVDGNGRTARLLMNLILMRAGYPPVIIRKQDRSLYYEYLQLANEGDVRPFIRFIAECTERTLDVYLYATEYGISGIRALGGQELGRFPSIIETQ